MSDFLIRVLHYFVVQSGRARHSGRRAILRLLVLDPFDGIFDVISHDKIFFSNCVVVLASRDCDEVIEHLIVRLIPLRVNLQVPVEELFVLTVRFL